MSIMKSIYFENDPKLKHYCININMKYVTECNTSLIRRVNKF